VLAEAAVDAAAKQGYEVVAAFEYEVRLRRVSDAMPAFRAHQFSLSELQAASGLLGSLRDCCRSMALPLAAVHVEGGSGLLELNMAQASGIESADRALLLKHAVKGIALEHGLEATFMAKPVEGEEGSSGHLHVSLWHGGCNTLAGGQDGGVSPAMTHAVAGLLRNMSALSAVYNPTLNSYKRLIPDQFAPIAASWGIDDRTAAVRVVQPGDSSAARVEVRRPGADANPYLVLAAAVQSMLDGLERAAEPAEGSGSLTTAAQLPGSLEAALRAFSTEPLVEEWFGLPFARFFAATRQRELDAWRLTVSDWERRRYGHFV
jgi:glutamine synthetase